MRIAHLPPITIALRMRLKPDPAHADLPPPNTALRTRTYQRFGSAPQTFPQSDRAGK